LQFKLEENSIIHINSFKLAIIAKNIWKITKVGYTTVVLEPCLTKKFEIIYAKEFILFVSSVKLYRVFLK
jgi:hypothetical protein